MKFRHRTLPEPVYDMVTKSEMLAIDSMQADKKLAEHVGLSHQWSIGYTTLRRDDLIAVANRMESYKKEG